MAYRFIYGRRAYHIYRWMAACDVSLSTQYVSLSVDGNMRRISGCRVCHCLYATLHSSAEVLPPSVTVLFLSRQSWNLVQLFSMFCVCGKSLYFTESKILHLSCFSILFYTLYYWHFIYFGNQINFLCCFNFVPGVAQEALEGPLHEG
jgi:hypothetical protein